MFKLKGILNPLLDFDCCHGGLIRIALLSCTATYVIPFEFKIRKS